MNLTTNVECDIITSIEMMKSGKRKKGINRKPYMTAGIYKIVNKINGKYYIGSTRNLIRRMRNHKNELYTNKHYNSYLQNAWNKYGAEAFRFDIIKILITTNNKDILNEEQQYLDIAMKEKNMVYNIKFIADGVITQSDLYKEEMIKNLILKNDNNIYTFINIKNGDACIGTRYDLKLKFDVTAGNIRQLIKNGKCKDWTVHSHTN